MSYILSHFCYVMYHFSPYDKRCGRFVFLHFISQHSRFQIKSVSSCKAQLIVAVMFTITLSQRQHNCRSPSVIQLSLLPVKRDISSKRILSYHTKPILKCSVFSQDSQESQVMLAVILQGIIDCRCGGVVNRLPSSWDWFPQLNLFV